MNYIADFIKRVEPNVFAKYIDHTLIKPSQDINVVLENVEYTRKYGFANLVVSPYHAIKLLKEYGIKDISICSIVGFPMGYQDTSVKVKEAELLIDAGVREIDMVMNIQAFKERKYDYVINDIKSVASIAHDHNVVVKVIVETGLLSDEEKVKVVDVVIKGGADYIKTCTGFLGGRALVKDVLLFKELGNSKIKVKASGGIRTAADAIALILAGADRIGTSSGVKIFEEYLELKKRYS